MTQPSRHVTNAQLGSSRGFLRIRIGNADHQGSDDTETKPARPLRL